MISWCDARKIVLKDIPVGEQKRLLLEVREASSPAPHCIQTEIAKALHGVGMERELDHISIFQILLYS